MTCPHLRRDACAWGLRDGVNDRIAALPPPYRREAKYLLPLRDGDCERCPVRAATEADEGTR